MRVCWFPSSGDYPNHEIKPADEIQAVGGTVLNRFWLPPPADRGFSVNH